MIVVDLDGTICDCSHRQKYVTGKVKDWKKFNNECHKDAPIFAIINLVKRYVKGYETPILFLTGRSDAVRIATEDWLDKYFPDLVKGEDYMLVMRSEGDLRPDVTVKPKLLDKFLKEFDVKVELILEDRKAMVDAWRKLGYTCLQVADGDF